MVRSILEGRKTQTRRVVTDQSIITFRPDGTPGKVQPNCRFGQPGDLLWVKETWRAAKSLDHLSPSQIAAAALDAGYREPWAPIQYEADGWRFNWEPHFDSFGETSPGKKRVSIHMPRWASRITLDITSVKVERLNDITPQDAIKEGIGMTMRGEPGAVTRFAELWESINGPDSWNANPWVWVIEFKKAL